MKTSFFALSLFLTALAFSNAEDSRLGVHEVGVHKATADRGYLSYPEDPKIHHRDMIESNDPSLPDSSQHQTNLVVSTNSKTPGTIRGGGLKTHQDPVPIGDVEPNARSITSQDAQNTVDINDEASVITRNGPWLPNHPHADEQELHGHHGRELFSEYEEYGAGGVGMFILLVCLLSFACSKEEEPCCCIIVPC